jgi:hypothetical protein
VCVCVCVCVRYACVCVCVQLAEKLGTGQSENQSGPRHGAAAGTMGLPLHYLLHDDLPFLIVFFAQSLLLILRFWPLCRWSCSTRLLPLDPPLSSSVRDCFALLLSLTCSCPTGNVNATITAQLVEFFKSGRCPTTCQFELDYCADLETLFKASVVWFRWPPL